jgi:hypothetical protein
MKSVEKRRKVTQVLTILLVMPTVVGSEQGGNNLSSLFPADLYCGKALF